MIDDLMTLAAKAADQADAVVKTDATTSLEIQGAALKESQYAESMGANLRVVVKGRVGEAGTTMADGPRLVAAAVGSARVGDEGRLFYPEPAPAAKPLMYDAAAAAADLAELQWCAAAVGEQLRDDGTTVDCHLERSVGEVCVANTRGVSHDYGMTSVALDLSATRTCEGGPATARSWWGGAGLPRDRDVAELVADLRRRLEWAATEAELPGHGPVAVCLTPRAVASVLRPVRQALRGSSLHYGTSVLRRSIGTPVMDRRLTLVDDPLLDGRPGSRAVDDEGVVCRSLPLIEDGVFKAGIYDLETAALAGVPATGHGRRTTFGKPQAAYSNLVMLPGEDSWERLLESTGDGLVVDGFHGIGRAFSGRGTVRVTATLAFRVSGGSIVGRVQEACLSGNVFRCLERVRALGRDRQWLGSLAMAPMVVEGFHLVP